MAEGLGFRAFLTGLLIVRESAEAKFSLKLKSALLWWQVSEAWLLKNGICSRAAQALPFRSNRGSFSIGTCGPVDHETPGI